MPGSPPRTMQDPLMTDTPHPLIAGLTRGWAGDLETLLSLYTEDCRFEDKPFGLVHHGHAGVKEVFEFTFSMMPDFKVTYHRHTEIGDTAAAEWTFTGSFHGEFEGRRHAGTPVSMDGVSFMTLRDGKILTNCDYHNLGTLSAQLSAA